MPGPATPCTGQEGPFATVVLHLEVFTCHRWSGCAVGFLAVFGVLTFAECLVGDQVHAVGCGETVVVLDGGYVPAIDGPGGFLSGVVVVIVAVYLVVVWIIFVAGFLEMVFQLLFCVAAALAHGTHLLRRRCGVGVLVGTMIRRSPAWFLAHSGIVPRDLNLRKVRQTVVQKGKFLIDDRYLPIYR